MTWHRFLVDNYGFVLEEPEKLLALVEQPEKIEAEYGDCIPDRIIVVRDTAVPRPYPAANPNSLRAPGSHFSADQIEFDVSDTSAIEAEHALLLWDAAAGIVTHLNSKTETQEVTT